MEIFKSNWLARIIFLFIIWRVALFFLAAISPLVIPQFGAKFPYSEERLIASGLPHFIWSFGNFDGVHYLGIAKDGYAYQYTQAFFPLYPILIKLASFVTFGNFLIAGLLVSNLAFLLALLIFFKFTKELYSQKVATWTTIFVLAFPTSFYFGAVYTEGIFFLMIASSFYLFYKERVWLASAIGAFASATRLAGFFLVPAFALKKQLRALLPLTIIPFGLIAYALYLKIVFNNPFYFLTAQKVWGQGRSTGEVILLPQVFYRYLKIFMTTGGLPLANAVFEFLATLFALAILIFSIKKLKKEWLIFSFLAILTPTLTGTLASMPRYILVAFPVYIVLASIDSLAIKITLLILFLILLIFTTILFTQGYWVA